MVVKRQSEAIWIEARKRWQINVQQDGQRRTFISSIPGKKGKADAEHKADKWLEFKTNSDIRFCQLWELFLNDLQEHKKSGSSANYIQHEKMGRLWILPNITKTKRLSKITPNDYQNCIDIAYKAGKSKRTCINIRASLTAVYKFARKNRYDMEKPEFLIIPDDAPQKERNILQPDDLKILFAKSTINHYGHEKECWYIHAWRFLVLTGLRRGELCGLMKDDLENEILHVNRSINSLGEETKGKTKNARRYFVLTQLAQHELDDQFKMLRQEGIISPYLFPDKCGERTNPNNLYKSWYIYRKQHNIQASIHEMRHTMISIVKADAPEELLKLAVGHSKSMDTFGVYGHAVDGEMQRLATIIDKAYNRLLK